MLVALVVSVVADAARPVIRLTGSVPPSWETSPVKAAVAGNVRLHATMLGVVTPASSSRLDASRMMKLKSRVLAGARRVKPSRAADVWM